MKKAVGLNIGGTTVKIGLVSEVGAMLSCWEIPTDTTDGGKRILAGIAGNIAVVLPSRGLDIAEVSGIGLAVPGPVEESGVVNHCLNLGWGRVNSQEELRALTGLRVFSGNDGSMSAWGEMWQGAAREYDSFIMLALGTGIGGGIVVNRHPLAGRNSSAGEVGHILVNANETVSCVCGNKRCMEQYGSARSLETAATEYLTGHLEEETELTHGRITARDVMAAAMKGDAVATRLVDWLCEALGKGAGILGTIVDPDLFIIGGGLARAGEFLLDRIRGAYRWYAFHSARKTPFVLAVLGNDAAIFNCAKAILQPEPKAI